MTTNQITIDRAVVEQVLEALDADVKISPNSVLHDRLRAALEQPTEQDKIAIMQRIVDSNTGFLRTKHNIGVEE